jgi:hypothetical protein
MELIMRSIFEVRSLVLLCHSLVRLTFLSGRTYCTIVVVLSYSEEAEFIVHRSRSLLFCIMLYFGRCEYSAAM